MQKYTNFSAHKFLIIGGTSKAGTTSVFNYLAKHPQICAADKETRFFLDEAYPLASKKRYQKDGPETYLSLFSHGPQGNWRFEATPDYLYCANAARFIKLTLPNVRFIFILREPVSRLVSWYRFARKRTEIPFDMTFDEYVAIQKEKKNVVLKRQAHPAFYALEHGRYSVYLRHYFELFGHQSILVLFYEDLRRDPLAFMKSICAWVSIDQAHFRGYPFAVVNKGSDVRHPLLHRAYVEGTERIRRLVKDAPKLQSLLRQFRPKINSAYRMLNVLKGDKIAMSSSTRDFIVSYYRDESIRLKELHSIEVPWQSNPGFNWPELISTARNIG